MTTEHILAKLEEIAADHTTDPDNIAILSAAIGGLIMLCKNQQEEIDTMKKAIEKLRKNANKYYQK